MTPKEKAEELITKYYMIMPQAYAGADTNRQVQIKQSKACAKIYTELVLERGTFDDESENPIMTQNFWEQVLTELNK